MYAGLDFDVADYSESEVFAFDIVNDLPPNDQVVSSEWSILVYSGVDPDAATRLDGPPQVSGNTVSSQRITALVPGVTYTLICTVQTIQLNTITLWSRVMSEEVV